MPDFPAYPTLARLLGTSPQFSASFTDLSNFPHIEAVAASRRARLLGQAGEHIVDSILLRHGLFCAPMPEGAPSDRLMPLSNRSFRLQIKTRTRPDPRGYVFKMQKGYRFSPAGCRPYAEGDYDIAALVALPINTVMFSAAQSATILMPTEQIPQFRAHPLASLDQAVRELIAREAELAALPAYRAAA